MCDYPSGVRLCIPAIAAMILMAGCASSHQAPVSDLRSSQALPSTGSGSIERALYDQFERWEGTRYRFGGMGSEGIDCSGLTYVVYRDLFDKRLPRTTEGQGTVGRPVKRRALSAGDLVFFKTGFSRRHVGIYIGDDMFLHASKSDGVRLSSLSSEYWSERYWKARRMTAIQAGM